MLKRERILVHEAGHLLYFLKFLKFPENLSCVEAIEVGTKGFAGVFILDPKNAVEYAELSYGERYITTLGGMIADIHFNKLSYRQVTFFNGTFNHGWSGDIQIGESNGRNWGEQRRLAWKLAKSFTKEDELFVESIVALFDDGRRRVTLDEMLPAIRQRFYEHRNTYSKNEQLKLFQHAQNKID